MVNILLAYIAGFVSVLSPCLLPLLPIILVGSFNSAKKGPLFLILGLIISFTLVGLFVSTIGLSLGINQLILQKFMAVLLLIFGIMMVYKPLYEWFSAATSKVMARSNGRIANLNFDGKKGQFILGLLLGAIWTPCVGPTLGSAITLATQGESVAYAGFIMFCFAIGLATPIFIMSLLSQKSMHKFKNSLANKANKVKTILGVLFIVLALLILTGYMTDLEVFLLNHVYSDNVTDFIYQY